MEINKRCVKCGYESDENKEKFNVFICKICHYFSPNNKEDFQAYISEKIPENVLNSLRKYSKPGERQKNAMVEKASQGNLMSRAPFGYNILQGKLIPAQNFREIEEIFEEFLNNEISLRQLAAKHNFSVNGLKKILRNFTYLGKIKFNNEIHEGTHQPLISSTLFNHVQNKLERLGVR